MEEDRAARPVRLGGCNRVTPREAAQLKFNIYRLGRSIHTILSRHIRHVARIFQYPPSIHVHPLHTYVLGAAAARLLVQLGALGASLPNPSLILVMIATG